MASAEELLDGLAAVRRALRRHAGRPSELAALTGAQLELVQLLRRRPGLSIADAARELGLASNTVSTLVGQLAAAEVVVRRVDRLDRRVARLDLTPRMLRRMEAWRDQRVEAFEAALAAVPAADRRALAAAAGALIRVAALLAEPEELAA